MTDHLRRARYRETWLDVVAAVDYLEATHRRGFTVWDALEEAARWWTEAQLAPEGILKPSASYELPWSDPDPLRTWFERFDATTAQARSPEGTHLSDFLDDALDAWLRSMSQQFNDGHPFTRAGT